MKQQQTSAWLIALMLAGCGDPQAPERAWGAAAPGAEEEVLETERATAGPPRALAPAHTPEVRAAGPIAGHPNTADLLAREVRGRHFVVATRKLPLVKLVELAEQAYVRTREWLGVPGNLGPDTPIPIYLCRNLSTIFELEERHGRERSDKAGRPAEFRGGYYEWEEFIAITTDSDQDLPRNLVHEIGHLTFNQRVRSDVTFLDEGFASLIEHWLLLPDEVPLEEARAQNWRREHLCKQAAREDAAPSLERLLKMGYWTFHAREHEERNYALAWHFTRYLVESRHPLVRGRYQDLLSAINRGHSAWSAFAHAYDAPLVESLWREALVSLTRWSTAFGSWHTGSGSFETSLGEPGSSALLYHEQPSRGQAWELSFDLPMEVFDAPGVGVGFIVGYRSSQDFRVVLVRKAGQEVTASHYLRGTWRDNVHRMHLPIEDPGRRLRLTVLPDESLRLHLGKRQLARLSPVEGVHETGVGLALNLIEPASPDGAEFVFRNARAGEQ